MSAPTARSRGRPGARGAAHAPPSGGRARGLDVACALALLAPLPILAACPEEGHRPAAAGAARRSAAPPESGHGIAVERTVEDDHDHLAHADEGDHDGEPIECAKTKAVVRLAAPEVAARAGLAVAEVALRRLPQAVRGPAAVELDERRAARLAAPVPGVITSAPHLPGEAVEQGAPLVVLASGALGEAKAALRRAAALVEVRAEAARIERDLAQRIAPRASATFADTALAEARLELDAARARLRALGVAEAGLGAVERGEDTAAEAVLKSPLAGTILERHAALGEAVEPSHALFVVADLSRLLLAIDLPEAEGLRVEPDARVRFVPDGAPGVVVRGKVLTRGTLVDPTTRRVRILADVKNAAPGRRRPLVPGMFGTAEVLVREAEEALAIPRAAVQWEGCHHIVFVEVGGPGRYVAREVELGLASGELVEVRGGLLAGERVVTDGSFLLKTEILKGAIGAGCCE